MMHSIAAERCAHMCNYAGFRSSERLAHQQLQSKQTQHGCTAGGLAGQFYGLLCAFWCLSILHEENMHMLHVQLIVQRVRCLQNSVCMASCAHLLLDIDTRPRPQHTPGRLGKAWPATLGLRMPSCTHSASYGWNDVSILPCRPP